MRPPAELREYVEYSFTFRRRATCEPRTGRFPTGRATLYFSMGGAHPADPYETTGLFCEGPHRSAFATSWQWEETVGVKLRAGGARAPLGIPVNALCDLTLPLESIWGRSARLLEQQLLELPSPRARLTYFESELVRRVSCCDDRDRTVVVVSRLIEDSLGRVRIRELVKRSGYSERSLRYRFDEWAGLTPKTYARIVRLRWAVSRLMELDTAGLATEAGYFDQAHMLHDFKQLVGRTPSALSRHLAALMQSATTASGMAFIPPADRSLYAAIGLVAWIESGGPASTSSPFSG